MSKLTESFSTAFLVVTCMKLIQCQIIGFRTERLPSVCGTSFVTQKFDIEIPKNDVAAPFECEIHVIPFSSDVCRLRVGFQNFQLPSTISCQDEFLQVSHRRLCGSISGAQIFKFSNSTLVIKYRGFGKQPMTLSLEQERCHQPRPTTGDCDVITSNLETEISNPNYPEPYAVPAACRYTILPASPEICQALVKFIDFNLPDSVNCLKARLVVDGKPYCGLKTGWTLVTNISGSLNMEFTAVPGEFLGNFRISVKQTACGPIERNSLESQISYLPPSLPCPRCCNRVFNSPSFILHNPGILDPSKPTDFNCIYQISPSSPNICGLRFNFIHFWMGQEDVYYGCTDSFLEIDGRRWCGCKDGLIVYTRYEGAGKDVFLSIRGPQRNGFVIEVQQEECGNYRGRSIPEDVTTINPDSEVEVFSNQTLEKSRSRFLVPSDEARCYEWNLPHIIDKIRGLLYSVYDKCPAPGRPTPPLFPNPPIIPPISPPQYPNQPPQILPPPVLPPPPHRPVPPPLPPILPPTPCINPPILPPIFPTNRPPLAPPNQFWPNPPVSPPIFPLPQPPLLPPVAPPILPPNRPWPRPPSPLPPALPCPNPPLKPPTFPPLVPAPPIFPVRCQWISSLQGSFNSPGYPWNYPPNQKCCYRIRRAPGFCSVQVTILDFDIFWTPKCWKDYLLVDQKARYCGQSLQASVVYLPFRQNIASLDFITDGQLSGRGFRVRFCQIPCRNELASKSDGPSAVRPSEDELILKETIV